MLSWPSFTTSATSTLPVCPDAAVIVSVRFAPLPPRTRPEFGRRASSVVNAVTVSEPALVCPPPTVTASGAEAIPLVTVTFFFFGWWIYFAFPNGPGITGGLITATFAEPWNPLMATHLSGVNPNEANSVTAADALIWHRLNGVFWGAFLLFSITTASIISGSIIERVRQGAFWVIAASSRSYTQSVTWFKCRSRIVKEPK